MKLLNLSKIFIAAMSLGILAMGTSLLRAQTPDSEKIANLFAEIKLHAVMAEADAEVLESYTRSLANSESHSRRIHEIREHVNDLIKDYNNAKSLRDEGSEWQKEAIDQLEPLLQGMANHLSASIEHLNSHRQQTNMPAWHDYIRGNRDYAVKAANLIRDYVDYSESKAKADTLEKKLELPTSPGEE